MYIQKGGEKMDVFFSGIDDDELIVVVDEKWGENYLTRGEYSEMGKELPERRNVAQAPQKEKEDEYWSKMDQFIEVDSKYVKARNRRRNLESEWGLESLELSINELDRERREILKSLNTFLAEKGYGSMTREGQKDFLENLSEPDFRRRFGYRVRKYSGKEIVSIEEMIFETIESLEEKPPRH